MASPPPHVNLAAAHGGERPESPSQPPQETDDHPTNSAATTPVSGIPSVEDRTILALQSYLSNSSAAAPPPALVIRFLRVLEDSHDTGFEAGLPEEVVARFLKTTAADGGDAEVCAVCLDDLGGTVGVLGCGHSFHGECIGKWLQKKNVCPLCKAIAIENC